LAPVFRGYIAGRNAAAAVGGQHTGEGKYMIKLLIVEDELITRRGLMRHVPWKKIGVDAVETAENAYEAFGICARWQPDIVLSDIKMRGMDGIEVCRQLRSLLPDCQIIFVSSYSYKEYLKAAIDLGAIQYVEKPVVLEELIGAVEKGIERIVQIKKQKALQDSYTESMDFLKREALFSLLSTPEDVKKLECQLRRSGLWDSGDTRMRIGIVKLAGTVDDAGEFVRFYREKLQIFMAEEQFYCNMDFHDNRTPILLATGTKSMLDRDGELIRALCVLAVESKGEYRHFLAVGAMVEEPGKLYASYQSACQSAGCLSYKGFASFAFCGEAPADRYFEVGKEQEEAFVGALSRREKEEAIRILEQIYAQLITEKAALNSSVKNMYFLLYSHIQQLEKELLTGEGRERRESGRFWDNAQTLEELHTFVAARAMEAIEAREREGTGGNAVIFQVIEVMKQRYSDKSLCIKDLADAVYLTPSYLSGLFKRRTGTTINQYLTNMRIDQAKKLLRDNSLKLYHVADLVGYEDAAYFARIFKAQTGMTPSEYKENKNL